jgi:hypothetical protein
LLFQFKFQERFHRLLYELLEDILRVDGSGSTAGTNLSHQRLFETFRISFEQLGIGNQAGDSGGLCRL